MSPTDAASPSLVRPAAVAVVTALAVAAAGCGEVAGPEQADRPGTDSGDPVVDPDEPPRKIRLPLQEAPCTVEVEGHGEVDIEQDYIPNVVACENGAAPPAALRAQAVQARGYLYYQLEVAEAESLEDSEADQVYDCDYTTTTQAHYDAAEATRGEYLTWNDYIVASFYVAGAIPDTDDGEPAEQDCIGTGDEDPTGTEHFVTYNWGLTGCDIEMTELGWRPDDCTQNPHNRGCASQNGQTCLADHGWEYEQMLEFYYGSDIVVETAGGECGADAGPSEPDLHCRDRSEDAWSCLDADRRVLCEGDEAIDDQHCPDGCADGECQEPSDDEQFCRNEAETDGWHCLDDQRRVDCRDGESTATEDCSDGCEDGDCLEPDDPEDEDDEETILLVTETSGVDGGCSSSRPSPLPAAVLVVLSVLAAARSRLTRADTNGVGRPAGRSSNH